MARKTRGCFVINGRSGVGKDTLVNALGQVCRVINFSSVDRIKEIAKIAGWDGVKDDRGRQFLVNLKRAMVEYGDIPTKDLVKKYNEFKAGDDDYLFIHIREPEEIIKFKLAVPECKTLLVTRPVNDGFNHQNDLNVFNYDYDLTFANDKPLEHSSADFIRFIKCNS
jgi:hypothetical protein